MAKFDLQKFKEKIKVADVPFKKDSYINVSPALQAVSGLQGFPQGHTYMLYGGSNGGKSSLAFHVAAQAQKDGVLPIFVITEGKMSTDRAEAMGVKLDEAIIVHATYIEDVFIELRKFLAFQSTGEIPKDILLIVDSIGNTISRDSVKVAKDGSTEIGGAMMKVARVIRENMRQISHIINDTRKINSPHYASLLFVNHSYKQPPQFPGGPTTDVPYGGDGIYYSASLVIKVRKTKFLKAIKDGIDVTFGIVSKLSVEKNHISGVSNSGDFVIVSDDIIPNEPGAIADYKAKARDSWGTFMTEDGESLEEDE
jgi:recombination protein RecA